MFGMMQVGLFSGCDCYCIYLGIDFVECRLLRGGLRVGGLT